MQHGPRGIARKILRGLVYALFAAAVLAFEYKDELLTPERGEPTEASDSVVESAAYRVLTSAGYRSHRPRYVSLVLLDEATEGEAILRNVCQQRLLMARLLRNLVKFQVAGIVVDKYFGRTACKPEDEGSLELLEALGQSPVAVTLGLLTRSEPDPDGERHLEVSNTNLIDPRSPPGLVRFGLLLLNHDTRKVPLRWTASLDGEARVWSTLSFIAALRRDPGIQAGLRSLLRDQRHPFASFAPQGAFSSASAASIYCLDPPTPSLIDCAHIAKPNTSDWVGRIAVIGDAEGDTHTSPLGEMPGAVLHANYIEALLDDRYFTPLHPLLSVLVVLCFCSIIQLTFWTTNNPERALLRCSLGLLALAAIGYFALVQFQFMLPPVFELGGLVIFTLIRYLDTRAHALHVHSVHPVPQPTTDTVSSRPPPELPVPPMVQGATLDEGKHP